MTPQEMEARAVDSLNRLSLACLVETFDWTDKQEMTDWLPTFRGWVMDALERRNPKLFADWMDHPGKTAREAFGV
jgi:hypothetical protein